MCLSQPYEPAKNGTVAAFPVATSRFANRLALRQLYRGNLAWIISGRLLKAELLEIDLTEDHALIKWMEHATAGLDTTSGELAAQSLRSQYRRTFEK